MIGVKFGNKHTSEFGLILAEKTIGLPPARTHTVDIPGLDGALDLSETLTGAITYQNRTLTFVFHVMGGRGAWLQCLTGIANYLHGKRMEIVMDADPHFYYYGRCTVNRMESNRIAATITITCDCEPYRTEIIDEYWKWDTFSFIDGIIYADSYMVNGTHAATIYNRERTATPTFTSSAPMTVTLNGVAFNVPAGTTTVFTARMKPGKNTVTFTGTGRISVSFPRCRL